MINNKTILKFFWSHIKPYKWLYLVMLLAPVVSSFYPFAYNYAIKLFLDSMSNISLQITWISLFYPIALFLTTQILMDIVWRLGNLAEMRSEPYVRRSIILETYSYVQNHSFKFFQNNFTGAISSKVKGILDGYDTFWAEMHHGLLTKVFRIFVNLMALMLVNVYLGGFVFIWMAIYLSVIYRLSLKFNNLSFVHSESRHSIIAQVADRVSNIFSIKAFAIGKNERDTLRNQINTDYIPKEIAMYKYNFWMQIVGGMLYLTLFIFTLFFVIHLRMQNLITNGDFALVFGLCMVTTDDIWQVTISLQDFSRSMGDLRSCLSILYTSQDNLDNPNARPLQLHNSSIEFKDVCFGYNAEHNVIRNLHLKIRPGEKIGIVGQSGSGKSTLINLLLKYFNYGSGSITISGQDIQHLTQDSIRENIAVIPQDIMLFHRSIMDNIRIGKPTATDLEVIEASKKAHIHDIIMSMPDQYDSMVGERGVKLSGGQRQRIAIARAILKNAPILILDEATSALDSNTEQLIQQSLDFLIEDSAKTVIAIAHRLSTLKHMDRIIVLNNGRIVEEGAHDRLIAIKDGLYNQLSEYQTV